MILTQYPAETRLLGTSVQQVLEPREGKLESPCEEPLFLTTYLHLKDSHGIIAKNINDFHGNLPFARNTLVELTTKLQ